MMFLLNADNYMSEILSMIQIAVAFVTLIVTWYIPKKIMWEQTYASLISDYRGYDFAASVQGIIHFFKYQCKCDVEKIKSEYEAVFRQDFINKKNNIKPPLSGHCEIQKNLHYQRRLLTQFYYQLDLCARTNRLFIGKARVQRDFTKGEADILKILFYMNQAVDESSLLFIDISTSERIRRYDHLKGINSYISHIAGLLSESGRKIK